MQKSELDNDLWRFAINFYTKPYVAEFLLHLQDEYLLDVNIILLMLYLEQQGVVINETHIAQLLEKTASWRQSVAKMRETRREIKTLDADLYQQAKQLELDIEQHYIANLFQHVLLLSPPAGAKRESLYLLQTYFFSQLGEEEASAVLREFRQQLNFKELGNA